MQIVGGSLEQPKTAHGCSLRACCRWCLVLQANTTLPGCCQTAGCTWRRAVTDLVQSACSEGVAAAGETKDECASTDSSVCGVEPPPVQPPSYERSSCLESTFCDAEMPNLLLLPASRPSEDAGCLQALEPMANVFSTASQAAAAQPLPAAPAGHQPEAQGGACGTCSHTVNIAWCPQEALADMGCTLCSLDCSGFRGRSSGCVSCAVRGSGKPQECQVPWQCGTCSGRGGAARGPQRVER
jgi:hypothetical protein